MTQAVSNRDTAHPIKSKMSLAKAAEAEEEFFRKHLPEEGGYLKKVAEDGTIIQASCSAWHHQLTCASS